MTFISYWKTENGTPIDFERWNCKRLATAIKNTKKLADHPIYRATNRNATHIEIYATPDGYTPGKKPLETIRL